MPFHFKHLFQSQKANGTDATLVRPTDWNADHAATADGPGVVGRTAAGAGPLDLLPIGSTFIPPGVGMPWFGGTTPPSGWLLCDGSERLRSDFTALFNAIGTAYGTPSSGLHFKLPDLRGRTIAGIDNMGGTAAGRLTSTVVPNGSTMGAAGGQEIVTASVFGNAAVFTNDIDYTIEVNMRHVAGNPPKPAGSFRGYLTGGNSAAGGNEGGFTYASTAETPVPPSGYDPITGQSGTVVIVTDGTARGYGAMAGNISDNENNVTNPFAIIPPALVARWIIKT